MLFLHKSIILGWGQYGGMWALSIPWGSLCHASGSKFPAKSIRACVSAALVHGRDKQPQPTMNPSQSSLTLQRLRIRDQTIRMDFNLLFRSERLLFRAIEKSAEEKAFIVTMMTDDPATYAQGTNLLLVPLRPEDIDKDLERLSSVLLAVKLCLIPETPDGEAKMIGWLHLDGHAMTRHHRSCQLGIMVSSQYQGKGYGTEAIKWALAWAFRIAGMHSVRLTCFSFNERAINLYKRIGFVQEGVKRESYYLNCKWYDHYLFSILDREWAILNDVTL